MNDVGYGRDNGGRSRGNQQYGEGEAYVEQPVRQQPTRTPLQWRTEQTFQSGRIVLVLQVAEMDTGGQRRSFRIGKESREQPDKPFPFMDPRDANDVLTVMRELDAYLRESGTRD
jgi:hypothetical protein